MSRLAYHGNGIALVFARTETQWFTQSVWKQASGIFFFEGRLTFHTVGNTMREALGAVFACCGAGFFAMDCLTMVCFLAWVKVGLPAQNGVMRDHWGESFESPGVAQAGVFLMGFGVEVVGVDATRVGACVVDLQASLDGTLKSAVADSVGPLRLA
jgi:hypothetical protein